MSDPIIEAIPWEVPVEVDGAKHRMFLVMEWLTGEAEDGTEISLSGTGGMGGAMVVLRVRRPGKPGSIQETINFSKLVEGWADAAVKRAEAREAAAVLHEPEPLTVLDRHGQPCPAATADSYPLTAACTCGGGAIVAMDGGAEWGHPKPGRQVIP